MKTHRFVIIFLWVGFLWLAMLGRGAYLQLWPNSQLEKVKNRQFEKIVKLSSRRGDILDRNGNEMAISVLSYSLYGDPKIIKNPRRTGRRLAKILNKPAAPLIKKLRRKKSRFVWIQRRLDEKTYAKIKKWKIRGLAFKEEYERIYPDKSLAAPVLGFVGREVQGLGGIEARYDKDLTGNPQKVRLQRDARGRSLVEDGFVFSKNPEGSDIFLTLDKDLQYWVEKELKSAAKEHKATSAWAVVLDPKDSAVLAMASFPSFDANRALSVKGKLRKNKVIHEVHEVGSVMKAFTIAGALQQGLVEPNTKINTENGVFKIGGRTIREADKKHSYKELTVSQVLSLSSNVGTSKIALKMTDEGLDETLRQFGFGEKQGIDLQGEAKGILPKLPWRDHLTSVISFGHGIAVTGLQVANAYAAIANGGVLNKPYLVQKVYDFESGKVKEFKGKKIRRVLDESVANQVKIMLSTVTGQGGTGINARIDGYPVAGKTGTAQKVSSEKRGYAKGKYISSFAGFVPANDPQFVIFVAVDSPMGKKGYYGAWVAAPLFRNIARYALRKQRTIPAYLKKQDLVLGKKSFVVGEEGKPYKMLLEKIPTRSQKITKMPDLEGMTLREVLRQFRGQEVDLRIKGKGHHVTRFFPPVGREIKRKQKVKVTLQ